MTVLLKKRSSYFFLSYFVIGICPRSSRRCAAHPQWNRRIPTMISIKPRGISPAALKSQYVLRRRKYQRRDGNLIIHSFEKRNNMGRIQFLCSSRSFMMPFTFHHPRTSPDDSCCRSWVYKTYIPEHSTAMQVSNMARRIITPIKNRIAPRINTHFLKKEYDIKILEN